MSDLDGYEVMCLALLFSIVCVTMSQSPYPSFQWSQRGMIPNSSCIGVYGSVGAPWSDNFLCSRTNNLSAWVWSPNGLIGQMGCTRWFSDAPGWGDSWICAPLNDSHSYIFSDAPIPRSECVRVLEDDDPGFGVHHFCALRGNMLHSYVDGTPVSIEYMGEIHTFIRSDGIISYFVHSLHKAPDHMTTVPYAFTRDDTCAVVFGEQLYVFYLDYFGQGTLWSSVLSRGRWSSVTAVPTIGRLTGRPSCVVYLDLLYVFYIGSSGTLSCVLYNGSHWMQGSSFAIEAPSTSLSCTTHDVASPKVYCFYALSNTTKILHHAYDGTSWTYPTILDGCGNMGSGPVPISINGQLWLFHTKVNSSVFTYSIYTADVTLYSSSVRELGITASSQSLALLSVGVLYCTYQEGQRYSPPGQMSYATMDIQGSWNHSLALNVDTPIIIALTSDPQYIWCDNNAPTSYLCTESSSGTTKQRFSASFIAYQYVSVNTVLREILGAQPMGVFITGDITNFGAKDGRLEVMQNLIGALKTSVYPLLGNHDYQNNVNDCSANLCVSAMIDWAHGIEQSIKGASYDFDCKGTLGKFHCTGSLAYSHNIGSYHFVHMHNYPVYQVSFTSGVGPFASLYDMVSAVPWLVKDLDAATMRRDRIVLSYHAPGDNRDGPNSGDWNHTAFYELIRNYNVVAVFTGHYHWLTGLQEYIDPSNGRIPRFAVGSATYLTYSLMVTNPQANSFQYAVMNNGVTGYTSMGCSDTYPSPQL